MRFGSKPFKIFLGKQYKVYLDLAMTRRDEEPKVMVNCFRAILQ
jgi:hypothetical protein